MNKQKFLVLMNMIMLFLTVAVACTLTFVVVGCTPASKVTNEDQQIARLQADLQLQRDFFADLNNRMDVLNQTVVDLIASTTASASELAALQAQQTDLQIAQTAMQVQIYGMLTQLAVLQGYTNIVGIVDICGDAPGIVDEVLLKLSNGRFLASFSDNAAGQNTRFSILGNGNYISTDGSHCAIHIQDGNVTW